ncbi:lipase (class 2) domain-containing protein [Ditylenchus destructor]|nr:lipase (class 2) domain-containing protein [Ditylenchus destructor]
MRESVEKKKRITLESGASKCVKYLQHSTRYNEHVLYPVVNSLTDALTWIAQVSFSREIDVNGLSQTSKNCIDGPFTEHFMQWLLTNGYADNDFAYGHMGPQASFGGKNSDDQKLNHYPVIFIHGNSDGALNANYNAANPSDEGWSASISEFLQNKYTSAELYAVTYGDRQIGNAVHR